MAEKLPISQSLTAQIAKETLRGPIAGPLRYFANKASGRRLFPSLNEHFGPQKPKETAQTLDWQDLPQALIAIDLRFPRGQRPKKFIGEKAYTGFRQTVDSLQEQLRETDSSVVFTDYLLSRDSGHVLFYETKDGSDRVIRPLVIDTVSTEEFTLESLKNQINNAKGGQILFTEPSLPSVIRNSEKEAAIEKLQQEHGLTGGRLRLISPITNEFIAVRHAKYDPEGEMFTNLINQGASSIKELQTAQQVLFEESLHFDKDAKSIVFDPDLAEIWMSVWEKAYKGTRDDASNELLKYADERLYYETVDQYLKDNPQQVFAFRDSLLYPKYVEDFKDTYLATSGQTETDVARSMLINYALFKHEGYDDPSKSPTQQLLVKKMPGFHKELEHFINLSLAASLA